MAGQPSISCSWRDSSPRVLLSSLLESASASCKLLLCFYTAASEGSRRKASLFFFFNHRLVSLAFFYILSISIRERPPI
jgi:hypothetical protein